MKKEQSFRKTVVGGFNRRDVIDYLARAAKERREETEALRAGAEKLRRERDDALEAAVIPPQGTPGGEYEEMRLRFYDMRGRLDEAVTRAETLQAERDAAQTALERFQQENAVFISDREAMQEAFTRVEGEVASLTAERAEWLGERSAIQDELERMRRTLEQAGATREKTEALRHETATLISDTVGHFNEFMAAGRNAALETVLELDRSRAFFASFDGRFAELVKAAAALNDDPRPRLKEFTPKPFEED